MIDYVIKQHNNNEHSSTGFKPREATYDTNSGDICLNLRIKSSNQTTDEQVNIDDEVKI